MIEESPFTANIAKMGHSSGQFETLVRSLKEEKYSEDTSSGFSIESSYDSVIEAYLIEESKVNVQRFDPISEEIIEDQNIRTSIIPFRMNFKSGFLYVFSNQSNLTKVISRLGKSTRWEFPIDHVLLDIGLVHRHLSKEGGIRKLSSVKIRNFETETGLIGTYSIGSGESNKISDLIEENGDNITILRGEFDVGGKKVKLGIYRSGTVQLYNQIDNEDGFWNQMEDTIVNGVIR